MDTISKLYRERETHMQFKNSSSHIPKIRFHVASTFQMACTFSLDGQVAYMETSPNFTWCMYFEAAGEMIN